METDTVLVTPKMAASFLEVNKINRKVRPHMVEMYADIIRDGEWILSPDGISFDTNGYLQNGQHRLLAVIMTGKSVPMRITNGSPVEAFNAVDQGASRNAADVLSARRDCADVISFACRILLSNNKKLRPHQLHLMMDAIGGTVTELVMNAPTKTRVFTSAPMKLAAALRIITGTDKNYVMDLYRVMSLVEVDSMPPIGKSLLKQQTRGIINATDRNDMLARGWVLYDRARSNNKLLKVIDQANQVEEVRGILIALLGITV